MRDCTIFRLAMLDNGYTPLLNDCKKSIVPSWPSLDVDRDVVLGWDRSTLLSTGMRIEGDLCAIDVDIKIESMVEKLAWAIDARFPALLADGLVRHAGGVKEAWFCRAGEPFGRIASRRWYPAGMNPKDPGTPKHMVECFGGNSTRQFGVDGPHSRDRTGTVVSWYAFNDGASPATVALDALPVLPREVFTLCCSTFDKIAKAAELVPVERGRRGNQPYKRFELEPDMTIDTQDFGAVTVERLVTLLIRRQHSGQPLPTLRCSGTFHDPTRARTDSHLISLGQHGIGIWDSMEECIWHLRSASPRAQQDLFNETMADLAVQIAAKRRDGR